MARCLELTDIESYEKIQLVEVFDITVDGQHCYYLDLGSKMALVHNSSKTFDFFHFLVFYCDNFRNSNQEIYIHRDTLTNCRDYTLKDFINCLKIIGIFDHTKLTGYGHKPYYNLHGNHVYFRGLDDENNMEGYPSDISFFNELLEVNNENKIAGIKMRCRKLIVADWNPKFTAHWAFEYEGRPNVYFTRTTFRDNKHCPPAVAKEILSYEPTKQNILNNTADDYRWNVYGLGIRSAPEGLIFQHVKWIDKFPDIETKFYGMDFGSVHPTTLVRGGVIDRDLYLEKVIYEPVDSPDRVIELLVMAGLTESDVIWADSANAGYIAYLRRKGWTVLGVSKPPGSVNHGIGLMKNYKINIVDCKEWRREQQNYRYRIVDGVTTQQPVKEFDDLIDAARYLVMANLQY